MDFKRFPHTFNLCLIIGLALISCTSGSETFKTSTLERSIQLSEEFDCMILTYSSTLSGVVKRRFSNLSKSLFFL